MSLFLIAHKVRGEAAFDVATQMECPICKEQGCVECDDTGHWWIIPTSGHRAYPYWTAEMIDLDLSPELVVHEIMPEMPEGLPDHYQSRAEPSRLAQLKALLPPPKPIHRRF